MTLFDEDETLGVEAFGSRLIKTRDLDHRVQH